MIQQIDPRKLIDYSKNTKKHTKQQISALARAFKEEGFHGCIVVDENLVILAGHGRKYAAIEASLDTVPVQILIGLSEEQKRSKRLGDNKLGESDWLDDVLKEELTFLDKADYDLTLSGFDASFLSNESENLNDPEDCPDANEVELRCALGETWQLGSHTLFVGDATDDASVFLLMQGQKADLILTDPPYNINYKGRTKDKLIIKNDSMNDKEFYSFLKKSFENYFSITNENGTIYIFHSEKEGFNFRKSFLDCGFGLKNCLIWVKNNIGLGSNYRSQHEPILFGQKGKKSNWYGGSSKTTILEFDRPSKNIEHPTMKPILLLEHLILNSSQKGELVVDLFGGSGSTLIACEKTNRVCKMMELDPKYASVIVMRWEKYTNKKAIKLGSST